MRGRKLYARVVGTQKFLNFFGKISQCRKLSHRAENQPIPYLYTLPNTLGSCPKLITFGNQSESSITSSESNTRQLRQPIRIEYYITRVVSQSESSITSPESNITSPESSRLGWETLLGSRLESARYSLS